MNRRELIVGGVALTLPSLAPAQAITGPDQDDIYWRAQWQISELEEHRAQYDLHETGEEILDLLLEIER